MLALPNQAVGSWRVLLCRRLRAVMDLAQYSGKFLTDPAVHLSPEILQFMLHPSIVARSVIGLQAGQPQCCDSTGHGSSDEVLDLEPPIVAATPASATPSLLIVPREATPVWWYRNSHEHKYGAILRSVVDSGCDGVSATTVEWIEVKRHTGYTYPGSMRVYYRFVELACDVIQIEPGVGEDSEPPTDAVACAHPLADAIVTLLDPERRMWVRLEGAHAYCRAVPDGETGYDIGDLDDFCAADGWVHFESNAQWHML